MLAPAQDVSCQTVHTCVLQQGMAHSMSTPEQSLCFGNQKE
jgi:hypothetical protein